MPRDRVMSRAVLCLVSGAVALFALPAPVESIRSRLAYTATTCTVLDRAASGVPYSGSKDDITDDIAEPMAAVRYKVGGTDRVSTGFNVRGSLRTAWSEGAYRTVPIGAEYPCWYDPARPERVVLRRGPSTGAVVTLIPIAMFFLGARAFVRAWRSDPCHKSFSPRSARSARRARRARRILGRSKKLPSDLRDLRVASW